jgi:hypothetical protein
MRRKFNLAAKSYHAANFWGAKQMPAIVRHLPALVQHVSSFWNFLIPALILCERKLFRPIVTIWLLHWLRSEHKRLKPGEVMRFKGLDIQVEYDRR